jgi:hypothetical protein
MTATQESEVRSQASEQDPLDAPIHTVINHRGLPTMLADGAGRCFAAFSGELAVERCERLALLWNACLGVPTAELQALTDEGGVAFLLDVLEATDWPDGHWTLVEDAR